MEETNILAESIIKIENVKEEPIDFEEECDWNFSDQDESVQCSAEIGNEAEELQPPLAVFVEPIEKRERTSIFEEKDPLAPSFESVFVASIKQENDIYSSGGGSFSPWETSNTQQTCQERNDVVLFHTQNRNFSSYHEALVNKHTHQVANPFPGPKSSAGRKFLHLHVVTRTSVKPYQCARCKVRFSLRSSIILHFKLLCTKICAKPDLQRKMINRRQTTIKNLLIDSTWKKNFRRNEIINPYKLFLRGLKRCNCSICLKSFHKKEQLRKHMHIHSHEKHFQSNFGKKSYTEKGNLLNLMRIHSAEDIFECSICKKCFTGKARLHNHMRIHTGVKPFQCSYCEKSFTEKPYLVVHMRVHTGEKPFKCTVCEKSFTQKTVLDIHMRIHTGEKPFQCTFCEKRFTVKGNLQTHMSIHTGDKRFQCTICRKTFTEKSYLLVHMRVHTGEKPFKCSVCEKCFTQKPALNTHMRVHTGEKPFQCTICGRPFSVKGNLSAHMRIHTGEKPFTCTICEKQYSDKRCYVNHMRIHASEKPF